MLAVRAVLPNSAWSSPYLGHVPTFRPVIGVIRTTTSGSWKGLWSRKPYRARRAKARWRSTVQYVLDAALQSSVMMILWDSRSKGQLEVSAWLATPSCDDMAQAVAEANGADLQASAYVMVTLAKFAQHISFVDGFLQVELLGRAAFETKLANILSALRDASDL
ncbi:hypothetical protein BJV78DRAFT_1233340 [Lactifluus subvellereus]|nr:hypothetical protein BJV78DRAFT_1233340 [Lactifluus subvellereus]